MEDDMKKSTKIKTAALLAATALMVLPAAQADARVFIGLGVGVPVYGAYPAYYPAYPAYSYNPYYYPPVYAPPPGYAAPPPGYGYQYPQQQPAPQQYAPQR